MEELLRCENITKAFSGIKVLDEVCFQVRRGEVHALIGENGAGKSTLMKIILGIYSATSGRIFYKGKEANFSCPTDALNAGISMIHQEISLVQTLSVAENIWIGRESQFSRCGFLDIKRRNQAAADLLKELGLEHLSPKAIVKNLSVANMQLVEIARAVSYRADLIIMDEPTSALTSVEIELLYSIIRSLAAKGVAVIFISHKLEEIFKVCDRVTVLRDGKAIITQDCAKIDQQQLIHYIIGRELNDMFPKLPAKIGEVVLEVKNLCGEAFHDVSFSVRSGEILGFSGLVGSGRTEIMRAVFGIDPHTSGQILLNGREVSINSPKDAVSCGLGMVTEDRLRMGAIHRLSVLANTTIASFDRICNRAGFFRPARERQEFLSVAGKVAVKYASPKEPISQLSGGNQQKVIISRWLLTNPKVLILDEPTRGIDVGSKSEIHRLISMLAQNGMAIVMISSEMPEILGMSDRIMVVREGRIVFECPRKDATQEELISHAFGTTDK